MVRVLRSTYFSLKSETGSKFGLNVAATFEQSKHRNFSCRASSPFTFAVTAKVTFTDLCLSKIALSPILNKATFKIMKIFPAFVPIFFMPRA